MAVEFKGNKTEVMHKGARVVIETLSVVDDEENIYLFDMADCNMENVERFIGDGCPNDMLEEYGVYLQV